MYVCLHRQTNFDALPKDYLISDNANASQNYGARNLLLINAPKDIHRAFMM